MLRTNIAWRLLDKGVRYWWAFVLTLVISFAGGVLLERIVIRPVENKPILTIVIVCIGLLVILNSMAGWIHSYIPKPFPSPFPPKTTILRTVVFGAHHPGPTGATPLVLALPHASFRLTTPAPPLRAAAHNPA